MEKTVFRAEKQEKEFFENKEGGRTEEPREGRELPFRGSSKRKAEKIFSKEKGELLCFSSNETGEVSCGSGNSWLSVMETKRY